MDRWPKWNTVTTLLFAIHPLVVKCKDFVSYNEGKTWPHKKLLHEIGGYSSTIVLDNYDIAMSHNHGFRGEHGIDLLDSFKLANG